MNYDGSMICKMYQYEIAYLDQKTKITSHKNKYVYNLRLLDFDLHFVVMGSIVQLAACLTADPEVVNLIPSLQRIFMKYFLQPSSPSTDPKKEQLLLSITGERMST